MQRIGIVNTGFNAMRLQMSEQPVAFPGANHKQVTNRFAINTHQPYIFVLAQIAFVNGRNPLPLLGPVIQVRKKAAKVACMEFVQARVHRRRPRDLVAVAATVPQQSDPPSHAL